MHDSLHIQIVFYYFAVFFICLSLFGVSVVGNNILVLGLVEVIQWRLLRVQIIIVKRMSGDVALFPMNNI